MKFKLLFLASIAFTNSFAQFGELKKAIAKPLEQVKSITDPKSDSLTTNDVIGGLKEALNKGIEKGTTQLSAVDGFFGDAAIKILMPAEAVKVEESLRKVGMGNQVDAAILNMNRAAEDACKTASPIFLNAIKNMSFADAWAIFRGSDNAATNYLQKQTTAELTTSFRPIIEQALSKIDATKHWNTLFTNYNRLSFNKVNPDLTAYVTEKALSGIFSQLAIEEQKIRKDPAARTTDILKNVFGRN
ncbi:MAG: DUF4197 domain-containing protein [Bacteroidetes bacterium]|nr:DUF4197 domain-containing protein [Bacteroidota bacterium]